MKILNINFEKNCAKLLDLRHGELCGVVNNEKTVYSMKVENGDGFIITIDVSENGSNEYIFSYAFSNSLSGRSYDYTYAVKVSSWTFSSMTELFPESRD